MRIGDIDMWNRMISEVFSYPGFCTSDFSCFEDAHQNLRKTKIMFRNNWRERERESGRQRETRKRKKSIWHPELECLSAVFNLDSMNINKALILNNVSFPELCATSLK